MKGCVIMLCVLAALLQGCSSGDIDKAVSQSDIDKAVRHMLEKAGESYDNPKLDRVVKAGVGNPPADFIRRYNPKRTSCIKCEYKAAMRGEKGKLTSGTSSVIVVTSQSGAMSVIDFATICDEAYPVTRGMREAGLAITREMWRKTWDNTCPFPD